MFEYRLAKTSDAPELKKLNDLFNGKGCNTTKAIEKTLKANEREIVCVAADDNKLLGFCCGQVLKSICYSYDYGEITEFFVIEEYRRQGIGKRLLAHTEDGFNKRDVTHLHVLTGKENLIAQALYRSCGYDHTSEIMLDKNITSGHGDTKLK